MGCKSSTNQQEKTVNTNSLFFKIGGEITIKQMVDKLYEFNLEDPSIKHFFAETKHEKLKVHLVDFLGKTFGGPDKGLNLVEGHSHINISDKHFDCFLENLGKSFKGIQQINETQGREILFRVELLRYWIVENSKIEQPLYIKLGGSEGIEQAVHIFYKRVLSDKEISGFFKNTDMLRQEQQQFSYLSMAFGGPNDYNGKNVFDAHKGMNIKEEHFDRVVMHLTEALRDMGVVQIIIEQVAEICYNLKGDIMRAQKVQEQPKKVEQKQEKPQQKQEEKNQSLYQQIGGKEAVEVAVKQFYQKVLADELVSPFFKNTDMVKQESQQIKFLTMALGGPSEYEGKDMYEAHKGMNIEEVHFDKIVELLAKTLTELGVKQEQLGKIAEICASVKGDIVEKKEDKNQSLYQQIGGKEAVELAVKQFYEKVLADELVSPFFKNTDMVKQESQQIKFLTMALGGPSEYEGKDMYEAHKGMNIEEVHFDKIVELLAKTLTELGVKQEQLGQIADICASVKGDIVEKKEEKQEEKQEEGTGQEQKSLYDRLGGQGAMEQAVKIFYEKMLADDSVNHFFKNTDMEVQSKQQLHFLSMAFGGPQDYNGRDMYTAHKGLNIQDEHYSTTVGHLASTLKDLGVSDELISEVAEVANSVKSDIVGV